MFTNKEEFTEAAVRYMDMIFRKALSRLGNPDDANDITQDVLVKLYKTDKEFESDSHMKNWLIRVTVNQCKTVFRSPWRYHENIDDYAETLGLEKPARDISINYKDGTEYVVKAENISNMSLSSYAGENLDTLWIAFNRLADPENISEIHISGDYSDETETLKYYDLILTGSN